MLKKMFISVLFIMADSSWSAEVDNFTGRFNRKLKDSTAFLLENQ